MYAHRQSYSYSDCRTRVVSVSVSHSPTPVTSTSTLEKIDFSNVKGPREETCARKAGMGVKNLFKKVPIKFPASWRNGKGQPMDTQTDSPSLATAAAGNLAEIAKEQTGSGQDSDLVMKDVALASTSIIGRAQDSDLVMKDVALASTSIIGRAQDSDLVMKDVALASTSMVQPQHEDSGDDGDGASAASSSNPHIDNAVGDDASEIECWEMDSVTPDTPDCDFRVRLPLFKRLVNSNTSEDFKRLCHSPSKENLKRLWHSATSFS